MSKLYLPNASQFDLMNENLAKIANAIGSDIDISTWAGIQKAVRVGIAPDLMPVGTQLSVNHSVYGEMLYDVVAHNHFKSAHDKNAHTMTLMCHDNLATLVPFDAPEAFYYANTALSAGTYNFTLSSTYSSWEAGTYQFTLSQGLPEGGQLVFLVGASTPLSGSYIDSLADRYTDTPMEIAVISKGNEGTSLGTLGVELNNLHRIVFGSNNYKESAIRQFLNSSSPAGSVWKPQTKFDRSPGMITLEGFMKGLDSDFLAVVGEVIVPCASMGTYESPDSTIVAGTKYTVTDKFYIASQHEIFGTTTGNVTDESVLFPYYEGATKADYIKYRQGVAGKWWTRTPYHGNASNVNYVESTGDIGNANARSSYGCSPICNIV